MRRRPGRINSKERMYVLHCGGWWDGLGPSRREEQAVASFCAIFGLREHGWCGRAAHCVVDLRALLQNGVCEAKTVIWWPGWCWDETINHWIVVVPAAPLLLSPHRVQLIPTPVDRRIQTCQQRRTARRIGVKPSARRSCSSTGRRYRPWLHKPLHQVWLQSLLLVAALSFLASLSSYLTVGWEELDKISFLVDSNSVRFHSSLSCWRRMELIWCGADRTDLNILSLLLLPWKLTSKSEFDCGGFFFLNYLISALLVGPQRQNSQIFLKTRNFLLVGAAS